MAQGLSFLSFVFPLYFENGVSARPEFSLNHADHAAKTMVGSVKNMIDRLEKVNFRVKDLILPAHAFFLNHNYHKGTSKTNH